jgi:hypothetical protein
MQVFVSDEADLDLRRIYSSVSEYNSVAARRILDEIDR